MKKKYLNLYIDIFLSVATTLIFLVKGWSLLYALGFGLLVLLFLRPIPKIFYAIAAFVSLFSVFILLLFDVSEAKEIADMAYIFLLISTCLYLSQYLKEKNNKHISPAI